MSRKGKVLFVSILVVLALGGLFFSHLLGCTFYTLERAVALSFASLSGLGKLAAGITAGARIVWAL